MTPILSALAADSLGPELIALRRRLHRVAEIGLALPRTQALVLEELAGLPLEIVTGTASTSIVAVLRGTGNRPADVPAVLLRGDMDALPITEATSEPFAAEGDVMHACGHDLHTAGLVGAARLLSSHRDELDGDVVFMFQPGEEGWDGAAAMIEEGVLTAAGPTVRAAYGLHVMSSLLPRGTVASRPGTLMAASAGLFVTVRGRGGHGSATSRGSGPRRGGGRARGRAADDGHPARERLRPRGDHCRSVPRRHAPQHHPRRGSVRGDRTGPRRPFDGRHACLDDVVAVPG